MTFDNNATIRYLMKEMDPSEEVIFEKKMIDDEDLLIEVECFRKVNNKIAELPEISPPKELTERILTKARKHSEIKNQKGQSSKYIYYSAAASLLVFMFAGLFIVIWEEKDRTSNEQLRQAATGSSAPVFEFQNRSTSESISPWIDNNDVLHFNDRLNSSHASSFDSIFRDSYQKLQPLEQLDNAAERIPDLHLTGSQSQH